METKIAHPIPLHSIPPLALRDALLPPRRHVDRVRNLARAVVLLPYLDRLVRLARDQPGTRQVELGREYPVLGVEAARLGHRARRLEAVAGAVVPEPHRAVVGAAHHDAVVVHGQRVDDGPVTGQVLDEPPLLPRPLLDVVGRAAQERVLERRLGQRPDRLLVVRERRHALAGGEVP